MYSKKKLQDIARNIVSRIESDAEVELAPAYSRYAIRRINLEHESISEEDFSVLMQDLRRAKWPASEVADAITAMSA